ncbi:hypothetical protein QYZ87_02850 [Porphyromonadaceae bacterium W3.11]|nr:hypothetical protein [Porphyromonadaceae bacterium W3.11]
MTTIINRHNTPVLGELHPTYLLPVQDAIFGTVTQKTSRMGVSGTHPANLQ